MKALIGTRKGLFRIERRNDGWHISEPRFLGVPILNSVRDPRDGSIWACAGHGHWGAKLYVSHDDGTNSDERTCPAFPEGYRVDAVTEWGHRNEAAVVKYLYTIEPVGDAGRYLIGCDPGGLFESTDGGETWVINEPLWTLRNEHNWFEGGGGVMLHTVLPDPRDADHLRVAVSCAGGLIRWITMRLRLASIVCSRTVFSHQTLDGATTSPLGFHTLRRSLCQRRPE